MEAAFFAVKMLGCLRARPTDQDGAYRHETDDTAAVKAQKTTALRRAMTKWDASQEELYYALLSCTEGSAQITVRLNYGQGYKAWKALMDKYESRGNARRDHLRSQLYGAVLDSTKDPTVYFDHIDLLRMQLADLDEPIEDYVLAGQTMHQLEKSDAYSDLIPTLNGLQLDDKLPYHMLVKHVKAFYDRMSKRGNSDLGKKKKGTALHVKPKPKKEYKPCIHCKRTNHTPDRCFKWLKEQKKGDTKVDDNLTCNLCKERGHRMNACTLIDEFHAWLKLHKPKHAATIALSGSVADSGDDDADVENEPRTRGMMLMAVGSPPMTPTAEHGAKAFMAFSVGSYLRSFLIVIILMILLVSPIGAVSRRGAHRSPIRRHGDGRLIGGMAMMGRSKPSTGPDAMIVDSGATLIMVPDTDGLTNLRSCDVDVGTAKDGESLKASLVGKLNMMANDDKGHRVPISFDSVYVVPQLVRPLLSVDRLNEKGVTVCFAPGGEAYLQSADCKIPIIKRGGLRELDLFPPDDRHEHAHVATSAALWHMRLAHVNNEYMRMLGQLDVGVPRSLHLPAKCRVCAVSKKKRQSFTDPIRRQRPMKPFQEIHMDLGDVTIASPGGLRYYMICTDRKTRFRLIYLLSRKSQVLMYLKELLSEIKGLRGDLQFIRSDCGTEFISAKVVDWARQNGIQVTTGGPYAPEQNGIAESANRVVFTLARALRKTSGLAATFWPLAMQHAVYLLNRMPCSSIDHDTPYHQVHGHHCNLEHIKVFGCRAWFKVELGKKLDDKAKEGILVGCDENNPRRYFIYDPSTGKVRQSVHVDFDESVFPARSPSFGADGYTLNLDDEIMADGYMPVWDIPVIGATQPQQPVGDEQQKVPDEVDNDEPDEIDDGLPDEAGENEPDATDGNGNGEHDDGDGERKHEPPRGRGKSRMCQLDSCPMRRTMGHPHLAHTVTNVINHYAYVSHNEVVHIPEPKSYKEAMRSAEAPKWKAACDDEMASQKSCKSWKLVERKPWMNVIKSRWVFKHKLNERGQVVRHKARLVIQGFKQQYGLDFFDTFAPVAKMASVRLVLAIAAVMDLELHQLDVNTAFLQADVKEEIFMAQPEGYEEKGPSGEELICQLLKSLYGLKQAPRNWNKHIDKFLRKLGFKPSSVDPCIYVKISPGNAITLVVLYVDDLIVAASNMNLIKAFKQAMSGHYQTKDLGECRWVLGMEVKRDRKNRILELLQTSYMEQVLDRFGMTDCNPVSTPADGVLPRVDAKTGGKPDGQYMSIVGALMYAAMVTRPDIAYAVQALARHLQSSSHIHWNAALRVLKYLKGTLNHGIMYRGTPDGMVVLLGYSDADWAGDRDTRRSTTGYVFMVGGGAVSWASKLQPTVALSTSEAEYVAACAAAQEALFQRQLMKDVNLPQLDATVIYEDNTGAIAMTENPIDHQRTKHIDIRYHFIRERVANGDIKLVHVATEDQLADLLTKPLVKQKVKSLRERMMGYNG